MNAPVDSRRASGELLARERRDQILSIGDGRWLVPSSRQQGASYTVDLGAQTCTCPDHGARRATCKHLVAAGVVALEASITGVVDAKTIKTPAANDQTPALAWDPVELRVGFAVYDARMAYDAAADVWRVRWTQGDEEREATGWNHHAAMFAARDVAREIQKLSDVVDCNVDDTLVTGAPNFE